MMGEQSAKREGKPFVSWGTVTKGGAQRWGKSSRVMEGRGRNFPEEPGFLILTHTLHWGGDEGERMTPAKCQVVTGVRGEGKKRHAPPA